MAPHSHVPLGLRRRSQTRPLSHRWGFGVALLLGFLMFIVPVGAGAQSTTDPDLDSDGDGIANSHDPDDDNDGITDDIDVAPFGPSVPGAPPTPNSIDPDADTDGDGIANSHDPDDDNDSIVDATDPAVYEPENGSPPSSGDGGTSNPGANTSGQSSQQASSQGTTRTGTVLVTGFPKTGAGPRGDASGFSFAPPLMILALSSLLGLLCVGLLRRIVPQRRVALVRRS